MERSVEAPLDIFSSVVATTGLLVLAISAWAMLSVRSAGPIRALYRRVDGLVPYWLGPLDQILLCGTAVSLTAVVAMNPRRGPWGPIVDPGHVNTVASTALLAAAAALLALLLFAATHARGSEQEARGGGKYLGRPVSSVQLTHSPWAMLLRLPVFQAMTILLFLLPLARTSSVPDLPDSVLGIGLGAVPPTTVFLSAAWCSAFVTVGGVLILHATTALRSSVLDTMDPLGVYDRIRRDVEESANRVWRRRLSPRSRHSSSDVENWTGRRIDFATTLPAEEQDIYLRATVTGPGVNLETWDQLTNARRDVGRAASLADRARWRTSRGFAAGPRRSVLLWRSERRMVRAARRLASIESTHLGREIACLKALNDATALAPVRAETIACVLSSATEIDRVHFALAKQIGRIPPELGLTNMDPREPLLGSENALPSSVDALPLHAWGPDASAPTVLIVPAVGFRDLASELFPTDYSGQSGSSTSGTTVRELLSRADDLHHDPTRELVLTVLVSAILDCIVLHRSDSEQIDIDVLASFLPKRPGLPLRANSIERSSHGHSPRRTLVTIIQDCAFSKLMDHTDLEPERTRALLNLVGTAERVSALLFDLTYSIASGRTLSARSLEPFFRALQFRDVADERSRTDTLDVTLRAFRSSSASHVISEKAIRFLALHR